MKNDRNRNTSAAILRIIVLFKRYIDVNHRPTKKKKLHSAYSETATAIRAPFTGIIANNRTSKTLEVRSTYFRSPVNPDWVMKQKKPVI